MKNTTVIQYLVENQQEETHVHNSYPFQNLTEDTTEHDKA